MQTLPSASTDLSTLQRSAHCASLLSSRIDHWIGSWLPSLLLRIFIGWEFFESGLEKWRGENWFAEIHDQFPYPLTLIPDTLLWQASIVAELLLPVLLVFGLATRLSSAALIVLTGIAWYAVHAGHGYNVCDNGFKLPLIYIVMLVALFAAGAGRASLDHFLKIRFIRSTSV